MDANFLTVGQAADRLGVRPADVSSLFYRRKLRVDMCPLIGGRRLIPPSYLDSIERVLRREGKLLEGRAVHE